MRDLKFRAWVKEVYEDGEFQYGGYMIEPHQIKRLVLSPVTFLMSGSTGTGIDYFEQGGFLPSMGSMERLKFDEIELMQYTGLNDRNNKEIYEGDIVSVSLLTKNELFVIKFGDGMFYGECEEFHVNTSDLGDTEVIGNIYENPDLLTK